MNDALEVKINFIRQHLRPGFVLQPGLWTAENKLAPSLNYIPVWVHTDHLGFNTQLGCLSDLVLRQRVQRGYYDEYRISRGEHFL